jgi:threonine/homoserine efflux transporter RhtA
MEGFKQINMEIFGGVGLPFEISILEYLTARTATLLLSKMPCSRAAVGIFIGTNPSCIKCIMAIIIAKYSSTSFRETLRSIGAQVPKGNGPNKQEVKR